MQNEEQAVLNFFSLEENLPLALSVAEQVDAIRQRMNNHFWRALHGRLSTHLHQHKLPWVAEMTEDRNTAECLVGLQLHPMTDQPVFLRLMMEQQYMGETLRIYYGVMWSTPPASGLSQLTEVTTLREILQEAGFKNNENFLGWNWTAYHPRRRDFLQRLSTDAGTLLDEASGLFSRLLATQGDALVAANAALGETPPTLAVSLDKLRANITKTSQPHP